MQYKIQYLPPPGERTIDYVYDCVLRTARKDALIRFTIKPRRQKFVSNPQSATTTETSPLFCVLLNVVYYCDWGCLQSG